MNTIRNIFKEYGKQSAVGKFSRILILFLTVVLAFGACQKDEEIIVSEGEDIKLTVSDSVLALSQEQAYETVLTFNWSRGTNHGTSSSISYTLELDTEGSNFDNAQIYDLGKGVYEKNFTAEVLNDLLLNYWNIDPGAITSFEARVKSDVTKEGIEDGVSETMAFLLTPYKPVSEELFMVGGASPNGWDISNATPMTANSSSPWIFSYEGQMKVGTFKFAVSNDDCWCQDFYTQDPADVGMMVYNEGGSGEDVQWEITEGGNYKITVDLLSLTITVNKLVGPEFSELYIVGDASPNGWNMPSTEAFTVDADDPFIFTYEATLTPGDFKISTFKGDWCDGQWLNASQPDQILAATDYIVTTGCDGPDNKWHVTEETQGRYKITVNLSKKTMKIEPVMLYIVGDGGPNGWNINNPEPMSIVDGLYVFEGALGTDNPTGEFKFSKYQGDWCDGDWLVAATSNQSVTDGSYTIRYGCEGDDNKWKLKDGEAGNYKITIDLDNETVTIVKQ